MPHAGHIDPLFSLPTPPSAAPAISLLPSSHRASRPGRVEPIRRRRLCPASSFSPLPPSSSPPQRSTLSQISISVENFLNSRGLRSLYAQVEEHIIQARHGSIYVAAYEDQEKLALVTYPDVGEEKLMLEIDRNALQLVDVKPYSHDVLLSVALTEV